MSNLALETALPRPGDVVAGKYAVEATVGSGAMGVVVRAFHIELGQRVAIKFLRPEVARDGATVARFLREARAAAAIQSEHVVRVYDVARLEDGLPYIVMEHLAGTDLHKLWHRRGNLPIAEAVDYALQACQALAEVHAAGIVHRDLKPGNLFLSRRSDGSPLVKVLDFGISKVAREKGGPDASLTTNGQIVGSIHYMSPEQLQDARRVDGRSDIWALGAVMYKMLTGRHPFDGATIAGCIQSILNEAPLPLGSLRADTPPELERVILRCLSKDVGQRFQNVADLADALLPLAPPSAQVPVERIRGVLLGSDAITGNTRNFTSLASLCSEAELPPVPSPAAGRGPSAPRASALEGQDTAADFSVAARNPPPAIRSAAPRSRRAALVAGGIAASLLLIGLATAARLLPGAQLFAGPVAVEPTAAATPVSRELTTARLEAAQGPGEVAPREPEDATPPQAAALASPSGSSAPLPGESPAVEAASPAGATREATGAAPKPAASLGARAPSAKAGAALLTSKPALKPATSSKTSRSRNKPPAVQTPRKRPQG
jgi:eukaryotic-like serine/threonine-protein kinase